MIRSPAGFGGENRIKRYLDYYQPSYGVRMLSPETVATPPAITNGILQEAGADFVMMEDGTSYILQEA